MEESEAETPPRYAELARRLLTEHAELFRVTPPRGSRRQPVPEPARSSPRQAPRRSLQLPLPLRPRVLAGGVRESKR